MHFAGELLLNVFPFKIGFCFLLFQPRAAFWSPNIAIDYGLEIVIMYSPTIMLLNLP